VQLHGRADRIGQQAGTTIFNNGGAFENRENRGEEKMNEVMERIAELEDLHEKAQRRGMAVAECFFYRQMIELKAIVKRGELNG
jgi:hypothetical protein